MGPTYFKTPADWRRWLEQHHATAPELIVGFRKVHTGKPSITWRESVDQALCFGWIDAIRLAVDADNHAIRFVPRRPKSIWSNVNVARVAELKKAGLMAPAGLAAFARRDPARTGVYSAETLERELSPAYRRKVAANPAARAFFDAQPPGYRKVAKFWVMQAKQEETRLRRLATLIADSAAGRRLGQVTGKARSG